MKNLKIISVLLIISLLISCSKDENEPENQPEKTNSIEYKGSTYLIEWGEFSYEGISDDEDFKGKYEYYLALYPSEISYNSTTNTYSGGGWYFEVEPLLSNDNTMVGTYEGGTDVYAYFETNVIFPITGENEGDIIDTPVYNNAEITINKTGTIYEISYEGKDDEGNVFKLYYKGTLSLE